jgi:hypothetical protein
LRTITECSIVVATIHARFLEVSVTIVSRRKFLGRAAACSLSSFIPFRRWTGADGRKGVSIIADEDELPHGCIFARMDAEAGHPKIIASPSLP